MMSAVEGKLLHAYLPCLVYASVEGVPGSEQHVVLT
jgi:hypothetical protein